MDFKLPDAAVFEGLLSKCKKSHTGAVRISYPKLAEYTLCRNAKMAERSVKFLISKGLILQDEAGYKIGHNVAVIGHNVAVIGHNVAFSKEERSKEENINKKSSVVKDSTTTHTTFLDFWKLFSPDGEYRTYEKSCKKIWQKMPEDWRKLAIEKAASHAEGRNPYYFLSDEDFLFTESANPGKFVHCHWLTGDEIDSFLRDGIPLAVCRNPETEKFGTVTKEDAEKFGLSVLRMM